MLGRGLTLLTLLLAGVVLWAFLPAVDNGFVNYDDPDYVTANPHVREGVSWRSLQWALASDRAANWHPLTWVSHQLDWELYAGAAWGHHLSSIALHALNVVLVFLVLRKLTGAKWRSLLAALFFGLHPLRVESVAWISERKDVLSTAFFLLSLWAYGCWVEKSRASVKSKLPPAGAAAGRGEKQARRGQAEAGRQPNAKTAGSGAAPTRPVFNAAAGWYALALAWFILGLMSKQMLVTLPFVLLLLDFWPLGRWQTGSIGRLILEKIPFFVAALGASIIALVVQRHGGAIIAGLPLAGRMENAAVSYLRYIGKLFYPVDLAFFYPPVAHWPVWIAAVSVLLIIAVSVFAVVNRSRYPFLLVGWFWFIGTLVPVIGLVRAGEQSMADRYSYIPSIGLVCALVWSAASLLRPVMLRAATTVGVGVAVAAAAIGCALLTRHQVGYWKNDEALFQHALRVTTGNYLAHVNLGSVRDGQGRFDEAAAQFEEALRIRPGYAKALSNLGVVLVQKDRVDEGIARLRQAIVADPHYADAHNSLGIALERKGLADEALKEYAQAVRDRPEFPDAHYNLGVALMRTGRFAEAAKEFQATIEQQPESADAHNNLGVALQRMGDLDTAIPHFRLALLLRPNYASAHFNLGVALNGKGQIDAAKAEFREALRINPSYVEARKNLDALLR
ncbi:MAG TPA: tetratricopeptide repeat protein [Verrucomicrobiae bacterium]